MYPKKTKTLIKKDTYTYVSIAALFITAKMWKQCKCPPTDEWIKKMWCIYIYVYIQWNEILVYNGILVIKKNEIVPFEAAWMDIEMIILSEVRQRQISYDITYVCNLEK